MSFNKKVFGESPVMVSIFINFLVLATPTPQRYAAR